jgi:hypothetical protein
MIRAILTSDTIVSNNTKMKLKEALNSIKKCKMYDCITTDTADLFLHYALNRLRNIYRQQLKAPKSERDESQLKKLYSLTHEIEQLVFRDAIPVGEARALYAEARIYWFIHFNRGRLSGGGVA